MKIPAQDMRKVYNNVSSQLCETLKPQFKKYIITLELQQVRPL